MVNTASNKLTKLFAIAALSMGALVACKDSASDNTSDRKPSITSDSASAVSGTSGYNKEKAPATAATAGRKNGSASVSMSYMSFLSLTCNTVSIEKKLLDIEKNNKKTTVMPEFPGGQG